MAWMIAALLGISIIALVVLVIIATLLIEIRDELAWETLANRARSCREEADRAAS